MLLALALAAGCLHGRNTGASAVIPQWSCDDGAVSCWNATRQVWVGFNGETICEWSCASYEGKTAALTMRVRPVYADPFANPWPFHWTCDARPVEPRAACGGR